MMPKLRILIVDDDQRMTHTLADILAVSGYTTVEVGSALEAMEKIRQESFDCVLTDIRMPQMDGVSFQQAVNKEQPGLPVILMTAYAADDLIQQGMEAGIVGVLEKPINIVQMLGFFSTLAKNRTVAIVDDDPVFCATLGDILRKRGYTIELITDPHADLERMISEAQVILLDLKMSSINGLDVLTRIRDRFPGLPILLVTAFREEMAETIKLATKNSTFTCLYKPLEIAEVVRLLEQIQLTRLRRSISKRQE
jgi:DNA-binding NtrC family response regulator